MVPKAKSETEEVPGDNRARSITIGPHKGFAGVVACFWAIEVEVESGGNHCSEINSTCTVDTERA